MGSKKLKMIFEKMNIPSHRTSKNNGYIYIKIKN